MMNQAHGHDEVEFAQIEIRAARRDILLFEARLRIESACPGQICRVRVEPVVFHRRQMRIEPPRAAAEIENALAGLNPQDLPHKTLHARIGAERGHHGGIDPGANPARGASRSRWSSRVQHSVDHAQAGSRILCIVRKLHRNAGRGEAGRVQISLRARPREVTSGAGGPANRDQPFDAVRTIGIHLAGGNRRVDAKPAAGQLKLKKPYASSTGGISLTSKLSARRNTSFCTIRPCSAVALSWQGRRLGGGCRIYCG